MFKIKISDFRIPLIFLLISALAITMAILLDNETLGTIFVITAFVSILAMLLVYYPIAIIKLFRQKLDNPHSFVNNTGILSVAFIVLGMVLKLFHLPGAGPIIIFGCTLFWISFLPSWYAWQFKQSDTFQRLLYFSFCNSLAFLVMAYEFKSMHWPGATILVNISKYSNLFFFLPFAFYTLIFKRNKDYFTLNHRFLFGFIIAFILSNIIAFKMAFNQTANDGNNQNTIEKNLNIYEKRTAFLYEALNKNQSTDSVFLRNKISSNRLKKLSDSCFNYLEELKVYLVMQTDELPLSQKDSITFDGIIGKANADIPTSILIGDSHEKPKSGKNSAIEIKQTISTFLDSLYHLAPEELRLQLKQSNPFDLSDVESDDNMVDSWEVFNFYQEPLAKDYTTLTSFQANIRFLEMTLLNELFNRANAGSKQNMAAQLAELAVKYETEKQDKKIAMLQKDQELNDLKLIAKEEELQENKEKIVWFSFAAVIVGILMVFVIRSNILRKQANKELASQKSLIEQQKNEVENQKHLVEEKQKEIVDSINYAKRLQDAILAKPDDISKYFPDNFLLFQPKDIVAGDFYFFETTDTHIFYAAADCTGHGVPGAMVSVVCSNALSRCVKEFKLSDPGKILDKARELVLETFSKSSEEVKDGMDISLLVMNRNTREVSWSGANNPLWYVQDNAVTEIKACKQPIGKTDHPSPFITHEVKYQSPAVFYLFTDGYADQFGGPKGKKFKYKQLEEICLANAAQPLSMQRDLLKEKLNSWRGKLEQVDDVCVIGLRL